MDIRKYVSLLLILMVLLGVGCSEELKIPEERVTRQEGVITLTASMPEKISTRLSLEQDKQNIKLGWKPGDKLHLYLMYAGASSIQIPEAKNISSDGRVAEFDLILPAGDYTEFDLYGIYGEGGLDDSGNFVATIPHSFTAESLDDLGDIMMLRFANKQISKSSPSLTINLENIGSFLNVTINNTGSTKWGNVSQARLQSTSPLGAHAISGSSRYNVVSNEITGTSTTSTSLLFSLGKSVDIAPGQSQDFWTWFVPVKGVKWPSLKLEVLDTNSSVLATSTNSKAERPSTTLPGKAFYLMADWDGSKLSFPEESSENVITFTTTRSAGSTIRLRINADVDDQNDVWIDLNNNGVRDANESVTNFSSSSDGTYTIGSSTVSVYGKTTAFYANQLDITSFDFSKAYPGLKIVSVHNNPVTHLDFSTIDELFSLTVRGCPLNELDLSNNHALKELYANNCNLTSLTLSDTPALDNNGHPILVTVRVHTNQLSAEAISDIIAQLPDRTANSLEGRLDVWSIITEDDNEIVRDHFDQAGAKNFVLREYFASGEHPRPMYPTFDDGAYLKVLVIGNSFSVDAVEQYLYEIARANGDTIMIGNLFIGGSDLTIHYNNALNNFARYSYRKIVEGVMTTIEDYKLLDAIKDEEWDYISLQQGSSLSGLYNTYIPYFGFLTNYLREHATNPDFEVIFHSTWAYPQNSTSEAFAEYYGRNQMTMFNAILDVTQRITAENGIITIVPSGTAIQNGRTSSLGDTFNRDNVHLGYTYGRYTAACTWYEKLFGKTVIGNRYNPPNVTSFQKKVAQYAAHNAVEKPYEVTSLASLAATHPDPIPYYLVSTEELMIASIVNVK